MTRRWAAPFLVAASLLQAPGHADLEQQIADVTARLRTNARNAELLLQRAELFRRHAEYAKSHADLDAVEQVNPGWLFALLARARTHLDAGSFPEAIRTADDFLKKEPGHPDGLVVRARGRMNLRQLPAAVDDLSAAIAALAAPMPDLLLERARAQAALGRLDDAVAGLDEGLRKLGEIPSLQLPAIGYERQRANFDGALTRVDRLIGRYPSKEPWLALRAEVLEQAGQLAEARAVFKRVIAGLDNYPPVRRQLDLTRQLEARVRAGLARVESRLKPTSTAAAFP